jgi:competence ComEA-like helix-hairpin-helix protein
MKYEDPFVISKRSKRGLLVLILASLGLIFFPRVYMFFQKKEAFVINSEQITEFERTHKKFEKRNYSNYYSKKKKYKAPDSKFNPNTYTLSDWTNLGLSEKQSVVILKFTSRGIYNEEDLKRIFVIPEVLFELIRDSVVYPERIQNTPNQESFKKQAKQINLINLNTADTTEFMKIYGIGAFYAKQIIRYREKLGGYLTKEQLFEVWKMTPEAYEKIKDHVFISEKDVKRININSVTIEELKVHPYLKWNQANSIVKMRIQRNGFKNIEEIKESVLIDSETYEKLFPYLSLH